MNDVEHPNDILRTILGSIVIELNKNNMYNYLKDFVIASPESLYYKGSVNSLLPANQVLYIPDNNNILTPIEDYKALLEVPSDIYRSDAELIMRGSIIEQHRKHLSTKPTVPMSFIKIVEIFILDKLNSMCRRSMLTSFNDIGRYLINDDVNIDDIRDKIEEYYSVEISMLYEFIAGDVWNIYFKQNQNSLLIIEKSVDWRIYDWHCKNYEEA